MGNWHGILIQAIGFLGAAFFSISFQLHSPHNRNRGRHDSLLDEQRRKNTVRKSRRDISLPARVRRACQVVGRSAERERIHHLDSRLHHTLWLEGSGRRRGREISAEGVARVGHEQCLKERAT